MFTLNRNLFQLFLQVSVRELHKNLVSATKDGGLKEASCEDDNLTISDSTLRSLLPPQLKKNCQDKMSRVVVIVSYLPKVCIHHYYHGVIVIKKSKDIIKNAIKRRSGEKASLNL